MELKAQERRAAKSVHTPCPAGPSTSPQAGSLINPTSSLSVPGLPASTALARLQEEQAPRKRKRTVAQACTEARHAGLPSLGYSQ
jgi:hypothetical protein